MKLAVVVGHTLKSPGAWSPFLNVSERQWNDVVAKHILRLAPDEAAVFYRDGQGVAGAYAEAWQWGCDAVVELHFNSAANPVAHGTETLWQQPESEALAKAVQADMVKMLGLRDRGAKQPWQGRGSASLTALSGIPSIIVEPFFGSNARDCAVVAGKQDAIAMAIIEGARSVLVSSISSQE